MQQPQIGIDIGGTKMLLLAKTATGLQSRKIATGWEFSSVDADMAIASFLNELPAPPSSIGIAIPGLVDESGQVIVSDVLPKLNGWLPSVKNNFLYHVCVLNDSDAALIEARHEVGSPAHITLIIVGTAIGASCWVNQQFLRGAKGWAGELGAIPIITAQGSKILDQLAGGAALLQRLGIDAQQLATLVEQQDALALDAIKDAGCWLGIGIATTIHLFNPEVLVLAGGTLNWHGYLEAALISAQKHCIPELWKECRIHVSIHGGLLVALGAMRAAAKFEQKL
ncbi:ROK family protein [Nostoc sp. LEGE 06077]|uniref:ROK family protein n=1 Tax=Nostoc sp. LEGE 06077 TaxID=915325 RepID=UPI00187E0AC4|nr:ROK family protein [Nostoc sp. LEGE 06077]MBE9207341.1 ROK family protein [Nostoc sp. LEGE 06077]